MANDIQKEYWEKNKVFREFSKDLKFNKKWYHLVAIFDKDQDNFDFNTDIADIDNTFDFNVTLDQDSPYEYSPNQQLDIPEFDFNSILLEQFKIKEIGLLMGKLNETNGNSINDNVEQYPIKYIVGENNPFLKDIYEGIHKTYTNNAGFYVRTAIEICDIASNGVIASVENNPYMANAILQTILTSGGGYSNEAVIQLLSDPSTNLNTDEEAYKNNINIITTLRNLSVCNNFNRNAFPDTIYKVNDSNKDIIPVDLKVAKGGQINYASGNNRSYMKGIFKTLLCAINSTNKKPNLMEYIQKTPLKCEENVINKEKGIKKARITSTENNYVMPELKGFLLVSSTEYDFNKYQLNYTNFSIRPIISCLYGRTDTINDTLFATKSGKAEGSVKYDNGFNEDYNDNANQNCILNGAPKRFATVVKNFFQAVYDELLGETQNIVDYGKKSLISYYLEINPNNKIDIDNIIKVCEAIGIEVDKEKVYKEKLSI